MDLRLDIERRKRFAGREREDKRSPGGSRGPSRDRSSEKSGKRHKKSKYVCLISISANINSSLHTSFTCYICSRQAAVSVINTRQVFKMQPLCVFTGRPKGSGIVLHPPLPLHPLHPPILLNSKAKSIWARGWITRRRPTLSLGTRRRITAGLRTAALEITRAITPSEAEAVDL